MPSYEYEVLDGKDRVLATETVVVPVASRDALKLSDLPGLQILKTAVRLRRLAVPQRITILGHAPSPFDHDRVSMKRLHKYEEKLGGPEFQRRMGMPAAKIKKVWAQPEPA